MTQKLITVDPGFGYTKAMLLELGQPPEKVIFPSAIGRGQAADVSGGDLFDRPGADQINLNGSGPYLVGKSALAASLHPLATVNRARVLSDESKVLVASALARLYPEGGPCYLVLSIPDRWADAQSANLAKAYRGAFKVEYGLADFKQVEYQIKQVIVMRQALAAFMGRVGAITAESKMVAANAALAKGSALVIDWGYHTVNIAPFGPGGESRQPYRTLAGLGAYGYIQQLKEMLYIDYDVTLDDHTISAALRRGKIYIAGKWVDLTRGKFKALAASYIEPLVVALNTDHGNGKHFDSIVPTSGSTGIFIGVLMAAYPHHNYVLGEIDQFTVATGLAVYAAKKGLVR